MERDKHIDARIESKEICSCLKYGKMEGMAGINADDVQIKEGYICNYEKNSPLFVSGEFIMDCCIKKNQSCSVMIKYSRKNSRCLDENNSTRNR